MKRPDSLVLFCFFWHKWCFMWHRWLIFYLPNILNVVAAPPPLPPPPRGRVCLLCTANWLIQKSIKLSQDSIRIRSRWLHPRSTLSRSLTFDFLTFFILLYFKEILGQSESRLFPLRSQNSLRQLLVCLRGRHAHSGAQEAVQFLRYSQPGTAFSSRFDLLMITGWFAAARTWNRRLY